MMNCNLCPECKELGQAVVTYITEKRELAFARLWEQEIKVTPDMCEVECIGDVCEGCRRFKPLGDKHKQGKGIKPHKGIDAE